MVRVMNASDSIERAALLAVQSPQAAKSHMVLLHIVFTAHL